jgi:O-succinylbenzoic acid--CoA ligase
VPRQLAALPTATPPVEACRALAAALAGTGPALTVLPPEPTAATRHAAGMGVGRPVDAEVALVVATSGSTGAAKGVQLSAAALEASAAATADRLGGPGSWLLALPLHHIAGIQVLVRSLLAGTVPEAVALNGDPEDFAAAAGRLAGAQRTYTALVPTQLARLLDRGGEPLAALARFDAVLVGGAATPAALLDRARAAGVAVRSTYGMTETAGGCVYDGQPLDRVAVSIEPDSGRIRIGGPMLYSGYRNGERRAGESFRTSDLGCWTPTGALRVLGRADDMIVSGGENVPPQAVEEVLAAHPDVAEVAVTGVPDEQWGELVVALVVPAGDRPIDPVVLRAHARARLPAAWTPRSVLAIPALPLRGPGKPDRAALRRLAARALHRGAG